MNDMFESAQYLYVSAIARSTLDYDLMQADHFENDLKIDLKSLRLSQEWYCADGYR